jgi:transketolase
MTNLHIVDSQSAARSRIPSHADALRILAVDAVQKANSGHPGMPMGMAEIADVLWRRHLRHNPINPRWPDRDRFVVSNGHGPMPLYALLHLTGYDLPLDQLRRFRQLHSKTPGHPEYGITPGVETTTGPLGQGLAKAVGMALAEKLLATEFNRPGFLVVDHRTYVLVGDGCLMEGISHEAASLAGVLGLNKLVCFYDDNGIAIDGHVEGWFTDDTRKRFEAYGWQVVAGVAGHDPEAVDAAIGVAHASAGRPTLICCKAVIGRGSPSKAGTHDVDGADAALGEKEVAATREQLRWRHPPFDVPAWVYTEWDARAKGQALETAWRVKFSAYAARHPALAVEFHRRMGGELPAGWSGEIEKLLQDIAAKAENIAARKASQNAIEAMAALLPELMAQYRHSE